MRVKDVKSDQHEIINNQNKSVSIIHNVVSGPSKRFVLIKKDMIAPDIPFEDTYFTTGHILIINNEKVRARDTIKMKIGIRKNLRNQNVYCIVCQNEEIINVNGIPSTTYQLDRWISYSNKMCINWKNNRSVIDNK